MNFAASLYQTDIPRRLPDGRAESINLLANVVLLAVDLAKNAVDDSGCKW